MFNGNNVSAVRNERFRLVLTRYYKSSEVPFEQFASSLLFDLGRDLQERFSCVRKNLELMSKLMTAVKDIRADVADMV